MRYLQHFTQFNHLGLYEDGTGFIPTRSGAVAEFHQTQNHANIRRAASRERNPHRGFPRAVRERGRGIRGIAGPSKDSVVVLLLWKSSSIRSLRVLRRLRAWLHSSAVIVAQHLPRCGRNKQDVRYWRSDNAPRISVHGRRQNRSSPHLVGISYRTLVLRRFGLYAHAWFRNNGTIRF
jgi:hypothetical protein